MKKTRLAVTVGLLAALSVSCSKDDNNTTPDNPDPQQPASIIGTWKTVAITSDKDVPSQATGTMTKDIWLEAQSCVKDNTDTYKSGREIVMDEGATKCNPSSPQSQTGTYTHQGSTLTINGAAHNVLQLDNTTLKYSRTAKYYFINSSTQSLDSTDIVATTTQQRQ